VKLPPDGPGDPAVSGDERALAGAMCVHVAAPGTGASPASVDATKPDVRTRSLRRL